MVPRAFSCLCAQGLFLLGHGVLTVCYASIQIHQQGKCPTHSTIGPVSNG